MHFLNSDGDAFFSHLIYLLIRQSTTCFYDLCSASSFAKIPSSLWHWIFMGIAWVALCKYVPKFEQAQLNTFSKKVCAYGFSRILAIRSLLFDRTRSTRAFTFYHKSPSPVCSLIEFNLRLKHSLKWAKLAQPMSIHAWPLFTNLIKFRLSINQFQVYSSRWLRSFQQS